VAYQRAGALTAALLALAVDECSRPVTGPTVLVGDHASMPTACLVKARHAPWASRGVQRLFLPPYSPELPKIERLWHRGNHYWLRPEDDLSDDVLRERIEYILTRVGTEDTVTVN
jgi:transposase